MALDIKKEIQDGKVLLGIEFGSTRIKAVLIDSENKQVASGSHEWENQLVDGLWTYSLDAIWNGVQDSYTKLAKDVKDNYDLELVKVGAIGISAMMHGYMAFNKEGELLVPFRTWRNGNTTKAAKELTTLFNYHIPERWSIAHLYQAVINEEEHVKDIDYITTLAGYIHFKLTGKKVLGIGDSSGMFPIDIDTKNYNKDMINKFDGLIGDKYSWRVSELLPTVLLAGQEAGVLTQEGAKLLDVSGKLESGIPCAPPEGDAGTGMVATNAVAVRTGNVSAGTSVFAMLVLEKDLKKPYDAIDLVTTPMGDLVAMVHCNNCTSDLNAWVNIFKEYSEALGMKVDMNEIYGTLYRKALEGDKECGGLLAYNYFSGENITEVPEGRPLFVRTPNSKFNLANFMRTNLYTSLGALKVGLDILIKEEGVKVDEIMGHGGLFKTKDVGQSVMAAAMNTPVTLRQTAGEGGAWGIALLASYMIKKEENETLEEFLANKVFVNDECYTLEPNPEDVKGFEEFIKRYINGLPIEKTAVESL